MAVPIALNKMKVPPYAGVKLVEFWDRLELLPYGWIRDCVALGKFKANQLGFEPGDPNYEEWNERMGDNEIWVVVNWRVFENEDDEVDRVLYCNPKATLEDAKKAFEGLREYLESNADDRDTLAGLEKYKKHIRGFVPPKSFAWIRRENMGKDEEAIGETKGIIQSFAGQKTDETREMYQARLKVLAGMQPKTVALLHKAEAATDDDDRQKIEREAVKAYFAEVGTYWTNEMIEAWLRSNPVGSEWICEFARLINEPERQLDLVNHELALNWIHRGYNMMTENELSDAIFKATGQYVKPNTLKKRRGEHLGLSTKRSPGPRPNSEQSQ
jgi:hypothetical protein